MNSFCDRCPNGADYPLHNYGDHSSSSQCRDSTGMHSGRYAFGYNGMDLNTGCSTTEHFLSSGEGTQSYTDSPTATPVRYDQPVTACSAEPSSDSLPCSSLANSPVGEQSHRALKTSLPSTAGSTTNSVGTVLSREDVSKASSTMEEEKPPGSAQTAAQNASEAPQIYPWMRKLHISHGKLQTLSSAFFEFCLFSECCRLGVNDFLFNCTQKFTASLLWFCTVTSKHVSASMLSYFADSMSRNFFYGFSFIQMK